MQICQKIVALSLTGYPVFRALFRPETLGCQCFVSRIPKGMFLCVIAFRGSVKIDSIRRDSKMFNLSLSTYFTALVNRIVASALSPYGKKIPFNHDHLCFRNPFVNGMPKVEQYRIKIRTDSEDLWLRSAIRRSRNFHCEFSTMASPLSKSISIGPIDEEEEHKIQNSRSDRHDMTRTRRKVGKNRSNMKNFVIFLERALAVHTGEREKIINN